MSDSQIHRFVLLHKELDADDGELTRTRKVRRGFISERYAPLIQGLYDNQPDCFIETEVQFEDGRKGKVSATVVLRDARTFAKQAERQVA